MIRFVLLFFALSVAHAVDRPRSPEQYLMDAGLWPTEASNTVAYQPANEFPFYDSRVDTCDAIGTPGTDAWPYDPQIIAEGLVGCYDLKPANWSEPTDTVDCSGNSAVHPNHSSVYIIRANDWSTGYSNANNGAYRWVLSCAGFSATGTITISADGVGVGAGGLRIYDCLNADGTYEPMLPSVLRTGTTSECHNQRIVITAAYIFVRSRYFEANTGQRSTEASRVQRAYQEKAMSGFDNNDYYLGGQTATGSGYNATWQAYGFYAGTDTWFQNARIVDCVARRGDDGDAATFKDWNVTNGRLINVEVVNCPRIFNGTSGSIPSSHPAGGHAWENIWMSGDGARNYGDANKEAGGAPTTVSYEYWRTDRGYQTGDKIPYGRAAGEPPSYAKAAAASDGEVVGAFNCDADKFSANCPYTCSENVGIDTKQGIYPGTVENLARRTFAYGGRANVIDDDNAIWDYRALPENSNHVTRSPSCGGSSGTNVGSILFGTQHSDWGWRLDLNYGECTQGACISSITGGSGFDSEATGLTTTNGLVVQKFIPGSDNEFLDEKSVSFIEKTISEDQPGVRDNYGEHWGMTFAMLGYDTTPTRSNREWFGSISSGAYNVECSVFIDAENVSPGDTGVAVDAIALYGSSVPTNNATNRLPTSGTYSKSVLSEFCFIERPWTAIALGVQPGVYCVPNVIPSEGSPIEGQCTNAAP